MTPDLLALANRALQFVPDGARIGLGSGHTAEAFLQVLGQKARRGLHVRGVPTSEEVAAMAQALGIPVEPLTYDEPLAVTIDGADEVERGTLNLIKGWGGALVRERIVAAASRKQVIVATAEKLVDRLGQRGKLPVEVLPFAAEFCRKRIEQVGGLRPALRRRDGETFITDNGNWIFDCALGPQADPAGLDRALRAIPGVVDTGLFLGTASAVLVASGGQVQELTRSR
ncbi:MAG TPA: ribose-5-phosphate isomerase RpiA [Gemmataceae bacterium]|nr:ribose-5-phosphate isomerase RpiA [Gemmataceae bacterium]